MARNRPTVEIFSLSFLDLIFCAMAGVLVLYAIEDQSEPKPPKPPPGLIQIELAAENIVASFKLENGSETIYASTAIPALDWQIGVSSKQIDAKLRIEEKLEPNATLTITIVDHDWTKAAIPEYPYKLRVINPAMGVTGMAGGNQIRQDLNKANGFLVEIPIGR